jgi:hypothetical protein
VRRNIYLTLALLAAFTLRLYPALLSSLPFSTDAWSPIRNAELILEYTPISLESRMLDGYNCYWPANSLFGVVFSIVTGFKPNDAMAAGIPLAGALTIPILYVLVRVKWGYRLALLSLILLATAYPYTLFTAGVTKETYANPICMLSILIFLILRGWRRMLLFILASAALVLSHHLTVLVAIAVLASISLASSIARFREGLGSGSSSLLLVSALSAIAMLYFGLYAYRGLKVAITLSNMLSAFSYQVLAFTVALYLILKPHKPSRRKTIFTCTVLMVAVSLTAFLCTRKPIMPDAPILPIHYMLYASSFTLLSPLAFLGIGEIRGMQGENDLSPILWLSTLVGLEAYAVFGDSPLGLTLAYRALNPLCIPLTILSAFGLHKMYRAQPKVKATAVVALIAITAINSYSIYASTILQERYMGYFWLYRQPEYYAAIWVRDVAGNCTVAGDVKTSYLLRDYFSLNVDVFQGLQYLMGKGSKPQILFIYDQMMRNGYVVYGGYSIDLSRGWMEKVFQLDLVYSSRAVRVYAAR